jgi:hypothetical protein
MSRKGFCLYIEQSRNEQYGEDLRERAPQSLAYNNSDVFSSKVHDGQVVSLTFSFAIRVLSVRRNSPAAV